jgi:hypothetical protein
MTTLTAEQKEALAHSDGEPVRVEDPETKTTYLLVREELFQHIQELLAVEKGDRSLYEFGEFHPSE